MYEHIIGQRDAEGMSNLDNGWVLLCQAAELALEVPAVPQALDNNVQEAVVLPDLVLQPGHACPRARQSLRLLLLGRPHLLGKPGQLGRGRPRLRQGCLQGSKAYALGQPKQCHLAPAVQAFLCLQTVREGFL